MKIHMIFDNLRLKDDLQNTDLYLKKNINIHTIYGSNIYLKKF